MKALILAAGYGTRLGDLTKDTPKPMLDIAGKPCLERIVDHLNKHRITEIIVNIHWLYPQIMEYFGNKLIYSYEPELLGESGTRRRLAEWLDGWQENGYLVCNGDTLTDLDITQLIKDARKDKQSIEAWDGEVYTGTMCLFPGSNSIKGFYGNYWQDIGTPSGLEAARKYYEEKK